MKTYKQNRTSYHLEYSKANQCFLVWREDYGNQIGVQMFDSLQEAIIEYNKRVEFFKTVNSPKHLSEDQYTDYVMRDSLV